MVNKLKYQTDFLFNYSVIETVNNLIDVVEAGGGAGQGGGEVVSVDGRTGAVTLGDLYAQTDHFHLKADIVDFNENDYATAAQGILAASAVQPADNISALTNDSGYVTSAGVRSTDLTGFTTSFNSPVTATNTIVQAMGRLQAQINSTNLWQPNQMTLTDFTNINTLVYAGTVGEVRAFPAGISSKLIGAVPLHNNGKNYDGASIQIIIDWALFNPPSAGQTVRWEVDYYFSGVGDTPYTASPITNSIQVDVTGGTINTQRTNTFPVISGAAGKTLLHVGIRRSGNTDTYGSDAILYGVTFKRV